MSAVWYVGGSHERTISAQDWAVNGITPAVPFKFDSSNGWSIDQASFSAGQIAYLASQNDFMVNQADGPRNISWAGSTAPVYVPVPKFYSQELTLVAETMPIDVYSSSTVAIHVKAGAVAAAGINCIFEASIDSTNGIDGSWFPFTAGRTDSNSAASTTGTLALAAGVATAYGWRASVNGYSWIRLRVTARTSGSIIASVSVSNYATDPVPAIQSHPVTVTPSSTVMSAVSTASLNLTSLRAAACYLQELAISNPTATPAFVKLYNKATAPVVATDVPLLIIPAPAGSFQTFDFGSSGKRFTAGIGLAITGAIAATDATNTVAGILVNGAYV